MTWLALALVVVVAAVLYVVLTRRGRRSTDGVAGFQRHMNVLSSDARREVIGRVDSATVDTAPGADVDPQSEPGAEG